MLPLEPGVPVVDGIVTVVNATTNRRWIGFQAAETSEDPGKPRGVVVLGA